MYPTSTASTTAATGVGTKRSSKSIVSQALVLREFKKRLRDNIKSFSDNFQSIVASAKIPSDEGAQKSAASRMPEYYTTANELTIRAALMVRAADELLKLNNDLKEFLCLHDFNFLSQAIAIAEENVEKQFAIHNNREESFKTELVSMITDIDKELSDTGHSVH